MAVNTEEFSYKLVVPEEYAKEWLMVASRLADITVWDHITGRDGHDDEVVFNVTANDKNATIIAQMLGEMRTILVDVSIRTKDIAYACYLATRLDVQVVNIRRSWWHLGHCVFTVSGIDFNVLKWAQANTRKAKHLYSSNGADDIA